MLDGWVQVATLLNQLPEGGKGTVRSPWNGNPVLSLARTIRKLDNQRRRKNLERSWIAGERQNSGRQQLAQSLQPQPLADRFSSPDTLSRRIDPPFPFVRIDMSFP